MAKAAAKQADDQAEARQRQAQLEANARGGEKGETLQELAERQKLAAELGGNALTPAPQKADVIDLSKENRQLQARRVEPAEGVVNHWYARVDSGTTREMLENSSYWSNYAKILRRDDEITIKCVDGSFRARATVEAVGPKDVKLDIWSFRDLDPIPPDALSVPSGYSIGWAGDIDQWRVTRGTEVIKGGFPHKSTASTWLSNHLMSLTR